MSEVTIQTVQEEEARRRLATILAALRYYQQSGFPEQDVIFEPEIDDIATDGGELEPLSDREVDELCEALNTELLIIPAQGFESLLATFQLIANLEDDTETIRETCEHAIAKGLEMKGGQL